MLQTGEREKAGRYPRIGLLATHKQGGASSAHYQGRPTVYQAKGAAKQNVAHAFQLVGNFCACRKLVKHEGTGTGYASLHMTTDHYFVLRDVGTRDARGFLRSSGAQLVGYSRTGGSGVRLKMFHARKHKTTFPLSSLICSLSSSPPLLIMRYARYARPFDLKTNFQPNIRLGL